MTKLQIFDVLGEGMRFGVRGDGIPYVVAADFARRLDYRDAANALRNVDDDEKGTQIVSTPGGDQRLWVLYEAGIWELIFLSRKPEAKAIKKRVKEILRKLRETGAYSTDASYPIPASYAEALELAARQARELEASREKVAGFDAFLSGEGCYLIDSVANIIGAPHKALWGLLYGEKILIGKGSRKRQPYALEKTRGWFRVKTHDQAHTNGHAATTTYATPYGAEQIRLLAVKHGLVEPQLLAIEGGAV